MSMIDTPLGPMEGKDYNGCKVFLGIRYAQAPVGDLRFRPPKPVAPWTDVYDATTLGPSAPQLPDPMSPLPPEPTDEDCLFLNIYTPGTDDSRRPVLFWIHGGAYVMGSGRMYDGSRFTREHDVVVVTINYRMGPLGFMHVGHLETDLVSSVNNGILDQICALEWVRDNIHAFGGDPGNVMIFGESAGGTSTAMLLGCPAADGLYHKAAIHSPNVDLLPVGKGHIDFTNRCIQRLGGDPDNNGMATLRDASVDELVRLIAPDQDDPPSPTPLGIRRGDSVGFSPALDGVLIPAPVADTVRARGAGNVPFLGGGCRHEGTMFSQMLGPSDLTEEEAMALFGAAGCDGKRAMEAYERFAPGSTPHQKLTYALTDTIFRNSMVRILDAAAEAGSTCWSWMCTWESTFENLRATHAIELFFLWEWGENPTVPATQELMGPNPPAGLGRAMRAYWANFARTGSPSADGEPEWTPYNTRVRPVLILDAERRMENDLDGQIRRLWLEP